MSRVFLGAFDARFTRWRHGAARCPSCKRHGFQGCGHGPKKGTNMAKKGHKKGHKKGRKLSTKAARSRAGKARWRRMSVAKKAKVLAALRRGRLKARRGKKGRKSKRGKGRR